MKEEEKIEKIKKWMKKNYPTETEKSFSELQWKGKIKAELVDCTWMMEHGRAKAQTIERWHYPEKKQYYFRLGYYTWSETVDQIRWGSQTAIFIPDEDLPEYMAKIFEMVPTPLKKEILNGIKQ